MKQENTKEQKRLTDKNAYELNQKLAITLDEYEAQLLSMIQDRTCKPVIEKTLEQLKAAFSNLTGQIYKNVEY